MDEAENLADRMAGIAKGNILAVGTADTLGGRDRQQAVIAFRLPDGVDAAELPAAAGRPVGGAGPVRRVPYRCRPRSCTR